MIFLTFYGGINIFKISINTFVNFCKGPTLKNKNKL